MRWERHVAGMQKSGTYRILVGRPQGRNYLEDQGVDGRRLLKWIFKMWDGRAWTGMIWLRIRTDGGLL
jgi:hypothetical protein